MGRKSRIVTYALGGVAAAVLVGSLAYAAAPGMPDWHRGGPGFLNFLQDMDADDDGAVTRAEIEAFSAQRAAAVDADKDGVVTVAELEAFREAERQKRMAEHLAAMDSDGDGKVTVAEWEAASTWRLARLDRDGDGTIELKELGRHRGHGHGHGFGSGPDAPVDPEN